FTVVKPCALPQSMPGFFFASRRRHTRSKRDWSSDVCSSDLMYSSTAEDVPAPTGTDPGSMDPLAVLEYMAWPDFAAGGALACDRSEERRVGKECRIRGAALKEKIRICCHSKIEYEAHGAHRR